MTGYGAPGFLAAYNAGPDRVDSYLAGRAVLPDETVNYVAAITPNLGTDVPRSGPFAVASARSGRAQRPTIASLAAGCDVNAAYNPNHPCTTLLHAAEQPASTQPAYTQQAYAPEAVVRRVGTGGCDLDAAYDPAHPCTSAAQSAAASSRGFGPTGSRPRIQLASAGQLRPECRRSTLLDRATPHAIGQRRSRCRRRGPGRRLRPSTSPPRRHRGRCRAIPPSRRGGWAIQVGAFASPGLARTVAEGARAQAPDQLRSAALALQPTAPFGSKVLYRARLAHLSANAASSACARLNHRQLPCVVVPPSRS